MCSKAGCIDHVITSLGVTISTQVYIKRGALMYLTPRRDARAGLEDSEQALGEKLAAMQALASANTNRKP